MTRDGAPAITIAIPVYNGADTVAATIESALAQDHPGVQVVLSDNASTDGTEEICRHFARADERVAYHRHPTNVGLLNNFRSAARAGTATYLRWLGDDDSLAPDYVSRVLGVFAEDGRRVLVTTQIAYTDAAGTQTLDTGYDASPLSSPDPVERLAEILRLLTSEFALLDPLYGVMRRDLALLPRRNMLREDEVFATRLALAGPWGHVPLPLAHRHRDIGPATGLARLLGVPSWQRHAMDVLELREMSAWIRRSPLDAAQRRRAHAELLRMYGRRKANKLRRGMAKAARATGRPAPA